MYSALVCKFSLKFNSSEYGFGKALKLDLLKSSEALVTLPVLLTRTAMVSVRTPRNGLALSRSRIWKK